MSGNARLAQDVEQAIRRILRLPEGYAVEALRRLPRPLREAVRAELRRRLVEQLEREER